MSFFKRVFGRKRSTEPELLAPVRHARLPDSPATPEEPPGGAAETWESVAAPDAVQASDQHQTTAEPALPQHEIPLKSLNTYRRDPGYQNFMQKAKRPPGVPPRRTRGRDGIRPPDLPR